MSSSGPGKLTIGQMDAVQGLRTFAEVLLQCSAIADVGAVFVRGPELADESVFDLLFLNP